MKVIKFGGSSLASAEQLQKVLNIVKDDPTRRMVVVSAPGKRYPDDPKVTDLLIAYYEAVMANVDYTFVKEKIFQRYEEIIHDLGLDPTLAIEINESLKALAENANAEDLFLRDAFLSSGENNNAKVIAAYFKKAGLAARYVNPQDLGIIVSSEPGNARILKKSYKKIFTWRDSEEILVIPGFFGYTENGKICTFSRGGSDISGSIVAAGVKADLYENFTDVDGIYSAHPGIIHKPEMITELTYREMRELAYSGFSVFHDEALRPSFRAKIPVVIKNTNNPTHPGTLITTTRDSHRKHVVGIAADRGFLNIYLSKYLLNREVGIVRKILQIFEELHISYEHMPSGIDDVSFILRESQLTPEKEEKLLRRIAFEIDPDELTLTRDLSMVVIVGEGMRHRVGVTAESTAALSRKHVNIEMISQGASEVSIIFAVRGEQETAAIRALYYTFFD